MMTRLSALSNWFQKSKLYQNRSLYAWSIPVSLGLTALKVHYHAKAFERQGFSPEERRVLNVQELSRQMISTILWLGTLFLAAEGLSKTASEVV